MTWIVDEDDTDLELDSDLDWESVVGWTSDDDLEYGYEKTKITPFEENDLDTGFDLVRSNLAAQQQHQHNLLLPPEQQVRPWTQPLMDEDGDDGEGNWLVDAITQATLTDDGWSFLVTWDVDGSQTWEPLSLLGGCREVLDEFLSHNNILLPDTHYDAQSLRLVYPDQEMEMRSRDARCLVCGKIQRPHNSLTHIKNVHKNFL